MRLALALALALLTASCVEETLVLGDGRARLACEEAMRITAPEVGCTTIVVESTGPYGCIESDGTGIPGPDHAGSWVRLSRAPDRDGTVRVTLLSSAAVCSGDAGAVPCPAIAYVRSAGETPCACVPGTVTPYVLPSPLAIPLALSETEVLLEPLGATFEISLCAVGP